MKKYIFSFLFFILSVLFLVNPASAIDGYSVNFEHVREDMVEYAVITGIDTKGKQVWQHTTNRYGLAELTRVHEIGKYQDTYLFNDSGTITALDVNTGAVKWKNSDFGGSAVDSYCFGDNGVLYLCGYYGPDFYAVDINGKTVTKIESFDTHYYWAREVKKESNDIVAVCLEGSEIGGYSEKNPYIIYVNLDDFSYSHLISDLIVDKFHDVVKTSWCADSIQWAVQQGITTGTGATAFSPESTCTTAQILTFLWRFNGAPESTTTSNPFSDVKASDWYYKAALWAYDTQLTSSTVFNGNSPCTRATTVSYLWKLAGSPVQGKNTFIDVPSDATYASAVSWAVAQNITTGISATTFSPNQTCTRGQIVTFLYRYSAKYKPGNISSDANSIQTPYRDILNMYYEQIQTGWPARDKLDVSYMFYQEYSKSTLSEIGFAMIDLNEDGVSELLISPIENASRDGMIFDLYSLVDGKVVHLASSGERDRYYLAEGNTINNESSGGASLSSYINYRISPSKKVLDVNQIIIFDDEIDTNNAFYGTSLLSSENDYNKMKKIPNGSAFSMIPQNTPYKLDSFANL